MPLTTESALRKDERTSATLEHRHFAFIAQTIAKINNAGYRTDVAVHFADELPRTNPRFDRARFLKACKVTL